MWGIVLHRGADKEKRALLYKRRSFFVLCKEKAVTLCSLRNALEVEEIDDGNGRKRAFGVDRITRGA